MNEYQQTTMNSSADVCTAQIPQHWHANNLSEQTSSDEILSNQTDKNSNKTSNATTINTIDESEQSSNHMMKKRVTPVPASYLRRRPNLQSNASDSNTSQHVKRTNSLPTSKKSTIPSPIFIAPKKSSPQPHSFSALACDDASYHKRRPVLERQTPVHDDVNTMAMNNPSRSPQPKFFIQSSSSEHDENSSDESDHESLLIRKKQTPVTLTQINSNHSPLAIFITDPSGNSFTYDPDHFAQCKNDHNEQTVDHDSEHTDTNTLGPNTTINSSSTSDIEIILPASPVKHDKHILHSIGEEEEEYEKNNDEEENNSTTMKKNANEPLDRRWSDELVKQNQDEGSSLPPSVSLNQIPPTVHTPTKLSKTKYILMKLHLTSSSKDDDTNVSPPKKRTVRRAGDKTRYQTQ